MSTAFLITVPLMLLAILIAVAPVLLVSISEHRPARGRRPRPGPTAPHRDADGVLPVGASTAERQAAIVALEEAAIAVNRLKARGTVVGAGQVNVRLDEASSDLHRALVSLGGGVR